MILATYNEDALMIEGLRSGARSYLLKDAKRQVLFDMHLARIYNKFGVDSRAAAIAVALQRGLLLIDLQHFWHDHD